MQKVAWPTTIVHRPKVLCQKTKNEFSAMPVRIPGSAIGSTSRNEIASRPKKRKRCTANAAADPSTIATSVAVTPALSDSQSASCMSGSWIAGENHFVESPEIGQPCTFDGLKAYRQMIAIGM